MKKILILIIIVLAIIGITRMFRSDSSSSLLTDTAQITLYSIDDTVTDYGFLEITFTDNTDGTYYVNAVADLGGESNQEFIVENATARIAEGYTNRFTFSLPEYFDTSIDSVDVHVTLTDTLLSDDQPFDQTNAYSFNASVTVVPIVEQFGLNVPGAHPDLKRGIGGTVAYAQLAGHDLEAPDRNVDVPDLEGGPLDCFAIATTNNLISLVNEHGYDIDFPEPADMIAELKEDMQWDNGILNRNFLTGKAAFVERYGLPIETTEIKRPSMEDLIDALNSGGAIEISTTMIRSKSGQADTGHVLTGLSAYEDGGEAGVGVHDPATPKGADMLGVTASGGETPFLIVEYPMWDGLVIIDAIFVQTWTGETKKPEEPKTQIDLGKDGHAIAPPGISDPIVEMAFAHTNPGVSSEVYVSVTTEPGREVEVKLVGPAIEPPSRQVLTADENGVAYFTWTIYQYGQYIANATIPDAKLTVAKTITVN